MDSCRGWGAGNIERKPRVEPVEERGELGAVTVPSRGFLAHMGFLPSMLRSRLC